MLSAIERDTELATPRNVDDADRSTFDGRTELSHRREARVTRGEHGHPRVDLVEITILGEPIGRGRARALASRCQTSSLLCGHRGDVLDDDLVGNAERYEAGDASERKHHHDRLVRRDVLAPHIDAEIEDEIALAGGSRCDLDRRVARRRSGLASARVLVATHCEPGRRADRRYRDNEDSTARPLRSSATGR